MSSQTHRWDWTGAPCACGKTLQRTIKYIDNLGDTWVVVVCCDAMTARVLSYFEAMPINRGPGPPYFISGLKQR